MTEIIILPHEEICPEGTVINVEPGISLCDAMLDNSIEIEHACENPVLAQPVMFTYVKDWILCRKRQKMKMTTWTKPGDWIWIHA